MSDNDTTAGPLQRIVSLQQCELLALAATAAGYKVGMWIDGDEPYSGGAGWIVNDRLWNPLTDDGDALRLAVALELEVYPATKDDQRACAVDSDRSESRAWEDVNGDKYAAMRRAIVRAAAALGKQANAALSGRRPQR